MGDGHLLPIDWVCDPRRNPTGREMRHDLVAVEVEIDPVISASTLRASDQFAIEAACGGKIIDWEGMMKGRQAHGPFTCHYE
jgi:hypothetical protein